MSAAALTLGADHYGLRPEARAEEAHATVTAVGSVLDRVAGEIERGGGRLPKERLAELMLEVKLQAAWLCTALTQLEAAERERAAIEAERQRKGVGWAG